MAVSPVEYFAVLVLGALRALASAKNRVNMRLQRVFGAKNSTKLRNIQDVIKNLQFHSHALASSVQAHPHPFEYGAV